MYIYSYKVFKISILTKPVLNNSSSLPHQTESGSPGRIVRIERASNQVPRKHTCYTINSSFLYIFKIVLPNFRSLDSIRSPSTNRFDMPGLESHSKTDSLN
jgi:hypothetical protein